jgi:hypothetical protein
VPSPQAVGQELGAGQGEACLRFDADADDLAQAGRLLTCRRARQHQRLIGVM